MEAATGNKSSQPLVVRAKFESQTSATALKLNWPIGGPGVLCGVTAGVAVKIGVGISVASGVIAGTGVGASVASEVGVRVGLKTCSSNVFTSGLSGLMAKHCR